MAIRDGYNFDYSKKKATYFVGVGVSVIKVAYSEVTERKVERLPKESIFPEEARKDVSFGKYRGGWYEIMGGQRDKTTNEPTFVFLRVNKNEVPKDFPSTFPKSLPYFILPEAIEPKYGVRATEISIVLLGSNSDQILPADYIKFEGGQLRCIGNGETANRFDPIKNEWEEDLPICQCAFSRTFERDKKEKILYQISLPAEQDLRFLKGKRQVLVQGAWRDITNWESKTDNFIALAPYKDNKPPCDLHARLRFILPELGMEVCEFEFRGKNYWSEVKAEIDMLIWQLAIYGIQIYQVPLILRVEMQTKNTAGKGTRNFPKISLRFRDPIENIVENLASKTLGTGSKPPEVKQLAQNNPDAPEDAEFTIDDDFEEDIDVETVEQNQQPPKEKPAEKKEEGVTQVSEAIQNEIKNNIQDPSDADSIDTLKEMIDKKYNEPGYADKELKNTLITGKNLAERNQNTINFLKELL